MGAKQGLEVLAAAANGFAHRDDVVFVFCGNGPAREAITAICGNLRNCRFIDLQPLERLNELLNLADIHVLPQRADAADLVMPSKLTGMLASGRAVIAMANPGTELYEAVSPRGVVVPPGEAGLLVSAIEMLAGNAFERARLGRAVVNSLRQCCRVRPSLASSRRNCAHCALGLRTLKHPRPSNRTPGFASAFSLQRTT
jgi:colanic acid biosynthesis glycosyl transferase WcaI